MKLRKICLAVYFSLAICGSFLPAAMAQSAVGAGLDCNGWSPISPNIRPMVCADPHGPNGQRFYDNGWYVGHDEPDVQFYSNAPGSGNNMVYSMKLPGPGPVPTQSGSAVAWFELTPSYWFSLAVCDPDSYPQNPCIPDSDKNKGNGLPTDAGAAVMELQLYPPGWTPFTSQISCDLTHWCAALTIDSLACSFNFASCNSNCEEPQNFAFIETNGIPTGPVGPGQQDNASFTPDKNTLLMNPGDQLVIIIHDTPDGLLTEIVDVTSGTSGYMVASAKNGFGHTDMSSCSTTPYSFHPEFSTARPENVVTWTALNANVNFAVETGHFEFPDGDSDDSNCQTVATITGCTDFNSGGDLNYDGPPYLADWPNGSSNYPQPVLLEALNGNGIGPMSFSGAKRSLLAGYPYMQFKTNVSETNSSCDTSTGAGCVVPPGGAAFYPFYTQVGGNGTSQPCMLSFGTDLPNTTNDFGKDGQYGPFTAINNGVNGNAGPIMRNPCTP